MTVWDSHIYSEPKKYLDTWTLKNVWMSLHYKTKYQTIVAVLWKTDLMQAPCA